MKIGSAYPSKYVKASDIPEGKQAKVVISHVEIENVAGNDDPDADKPVLYFEGKQKGMVLNKTNAGVISAAYGDETDDWVGKPILIYASETTFGGKLVPCLRVKVDRSPRQQTVAAPARQQQAPAQRGRAQSDEFNGEGSTDDNREQAMADDVASF